MNDKSIRLEGTVEEIIFQNSTNGYVVLDLSTENDLITVVGELGNVKEGECLILDGEYSTHSKFGTQFRATYCERKLPDNSIDIEKYLGSGIIKGIGPATAKKIVSTFGDDTFDIIENQPERLMDIKGITKSKAIKISKEFKNIFNLRKVTSYLQDFGIKPSIAMKVFRKWDFQAIEKIKENPYILCCDGFNVPFQTVEVIAKSCGIEKTSYKRISAGMDYVLMLANFDGHSCMLLSEFIKSTCKLLSIWSQDVILENLSISIEKNLIFKYIDRNNNIFIYSRQYYLAEKYIAKKVSLMSKKVSSKEKDFSKVINSLEKLNKITYCNRQREAINKSINSNFMILTGGPGTGKTTTLNAIISIFYNQNLKVKIVAPTGRATKRISEVTGFDAMTIHRLLEVNFDEDGNQTFFHNEDNPIKCDVLIVDETSMVDVLLFESLLKAISISCKVILVGDSNQLPSVSAGNLLKDLMSSQKIDVVILDEIFRQAQESAIIMNAHKILKGEYPDIYQKDNDFFFLQRLNPIQAQNTILELWKDRLPKAYNYNSIEDIQILSPSKKGTLGTINLNKIIQQAINPHKTGQKEVKGINYTFRIGDKVMQIKNNYDIVWHKNGVQGSGIYNGDIGIIKNITQYELEIDFDGRLVTYEIELADQLELAYSITIHKSQGSEFDVVIIPMLNNFRMLSYRNLLYTGITRAKKLLIIVGSVNQLFRMVDNNKQILRYTCLKDMILNEFQND